MAKKQNEKKDDRTRLWTFIVYPDSAPENWREIIDEWHIAGCISPFHEFDKNPDGETKKPHYHVILSFDGNKSYEQIVELIAPLHCPIPKRVQSIRTMVRYLIHEDNPEKYHYSKEGIVAFGGFDFLQYFQYAEAVRKQELKKMREFIRDNGITEFSDFVDACDANFPCWSDLLDSNSSYVISLYITSMRHKKESVRE